LEQIKSVNIKDLVYVDESGIDSYFYRSYGWAPRHERVYGAISGKRFARESFIAAKCDSKVFAPLCFQGTCNTLLFNAWVEHFLVPQLRKGQIVILDNASFHKSQVAKTLIEKAGCCVLFLPPYSPDLNPIEKYWSWFKSKVRSVVHLFNHLSQAIDYVFSM
jgi:transposase